MRFLNNDLLVRMVVALLAFLVLLFAAVLPYIFLFPIFTFIIVCVLAWEAWRLLSISHFSRYMCQSIFMVLYLVLAYCRMRNVTWVDDALLLLSSVVWLSVIPLTLLNASVDHLKKMTPIYHVIWMNVALFSFAIALLRLHEKSLVLFFTAWFIVWLMDSAAYLGGRLWGKHALSEALSPKKTIEGAMVALLVLFVVFAVAWPLYARRDLTFSVSHFFLVLAMCAFLSIIGDLFESAMKRIAGAKDSGRLLPGHGGLFDRLDSIIAVFPVFCILMQA